MSTEMVKYGWPSATIGKWNHAAYCDLLCGAKKDAFILALMRSRAVLGDA